MGATLSYEVEPAPSDTVAGLIIKEAANLARIANHWCEPFCFHIDETGALRWRIGFEGSPVGMVDAQGAYSDDLKAFLAELHLAAGTPRDHEAVKAKVSTLLTKYADR